MCNLFHSNMMWATNSFAIIGELHDVLSNSSIRLVCFIWKCFLRVYNFTASAMDRSSRTEHAARITLRTSSSLAPSSKTILHVSISVDISNSPNPILHFVPFLSTPFEEYALNPFLLFASFLSKLQFFSFFCIAEICTWTNRTPYSISGQP